MKQSTAVLYEGNEHYIFVSYCHQDTAAALPILERLTQEGYRLWYDENIDPGTEYTEIIAQHLKNASACIGLISNHYLASTYCKWEMNYALMKKIPFLPVMMEEVEMSAGVEMQLITKQAIYKYKLPSEDAFYQKINHASILRSSRILPVSKEETTETGAQSHDAGKTPEPEGQLVRKDHLKTRRWKYLIRRRRKNLQTIKIAVAVVLAIAVIIGIVVSINSARRPEQNDPQTQESAAPATGEPAPTSDSVMDIDFAEHEGQNDPQTQESAAPATDEQAPTSDSTYNDGGFALDEKGRLTSIDSDHPSHFGIDVSEFQGEIDWEAVAADGVEFAIIRVGYRSYGSAGTLVEDPFFYKNLIGAKEAGIQVGVYFFSQATSVDEAEEEAFFVLERLRGVELEKPVIFDWEQIKRDGSRTEDPDFNTVTDCIITFCEAIRSAGFTPMMYMNKTMAYQLIDLSRLQSYETWLAWYHTDLDYIYDYRMWQYGTGYVQGISTKVDLDIWIE